jgi:hypothetical protein
MNDARAIIRKAIPKGLVVRPGRLEGGVFTFRITGVGENAGFRYIVSVPEQRIYDSDFFDDHAVVIEERLAKFRRDYKRGEVDSGEPPTQE